MMGLRHKKMEEEERDKLFWHIINNKRMFQSLFEIIPYYLAWVFATILLVNVSAYFFTFANSGHFPVEIIWQTSPCDDHHRHWGLRVLRKGMVR